MSPDDVFARVRLVVLVAAAVALVCSLMRSSYSDAASGSREDHNPGVAQLLDSALKERLRAVLDRQPVTEAQLRKLAEEGRACVLILGGQLQRSARRLGELSSDPASSLSEVAATLRAVHELRPDLEELEELLDELEQRAREFRAAWLSAS